MACEFLPYTDEELAGMAAPLPTAHDPADGCVTRLAREVLRLRAELAELSAAVAALPASYQDSVTDHMAAWMVAGVRPYAEADFTLNFRSDDTENSG